MPQKARHSSFDRTTSRQSLVGEAILYDVLVKGGELSPERVAKLRSMFESSIREVAMKRKNMEDTPFSDIVLDVGANLFTDLVFAFNILLVGTLDPNDHLQFSYSPSRYVEQNLIEVPTLVEKRLRSLTSSGTNSTTLARAYIRLIEMALAADFLRLLDD